MYWIYLVIGGLFEVGFAICLKYSQNFTKLWPSIGFAACISLSFWMLNKAAQGIPIGTAYAVWTGIGAAGTVLLGIWLFKESADFWRLFFLSTLIASIIGLKLFAK